MKKKIDTQSIIMQGKDIIDSNMDGEIVMMNIEKGNYYNLGTVGGVIWKMIHSPIKVEDIIVKILEQYEVDKETCSNEVIDFLNDLYEQDLVRIFEEQE